MISLEYSSCHHPSSSRHYYQTGRYRQPKDQDHHRRAQRTLLGPQATRVAGEGPVEIGQQQLSTLEGRLRPADSIEGGSRRSDVLLHLP